MNDPQQTSPSPVAFAPYFRDHFYDKMLRPAGVNPVRNRADSLLRIFEALDATPRADGAYFILETGTMRADHGSFCFGDDGCSTIIFDTFMHKVCDGGRRGSFVSVDISSSNCDFARANTRCAEVVCSDSVPFIDRIPASVKWDVVYLDSFDVLRDNPHPSAMHHLKELCAVMKNTRATGAGAELGTIICVDDADAFFDGGKIGKAMYVREFMEHIGAKKLHDGYQLVYQL